MSLAHALALGVVQGLTEFLPVSSSGHLVLVPVLFGWPDQGLAFDAAVHLGTSLALVFYFWSELRRIAAGALAGRRADWRLVAALLAGTAPASVAGLMLEETVATYLRSAVVVAAATIGWGLVLWWADRQATRTGVTQLGAVGVSRGFVIGAAQVLALVPGTSRSGITMSAGLFAGLDRPTAARFAFLLGLPVTAGAGAMKTVAILEGGAGGPGAAALTLGVVTSFVAGLAAVWFLIRFLQHRTLLVFVGYRILLGLVILALVLAGRI